MMDITLLDLKKDGDTSLPSLGLGVYRRKNSWKNMIM
jgi:hypothetical protein